MKKKKIFTGIFVLLVGLFCAYNIFWFASTRYKYKDYLEAVPESYGAHIQYDEKDHLTYNVKMPDYLQFTGNLGVSDEKGVSLLIWPSLFGNKFTYGVRIQDDSDVYEIYINQKLESITGNQEDKVIVEKYNSDIKELYDKAKRKFKKVS